MDAAAALGISYKRSKLVPITVLPHHSADGIAGSSKGKKRRQPVNVKEEEGEQGDDGMDVDDGEGEEEQKVETGPPCLADGCPRRVTPGSRTEVGACCVLVTTNLLVSLLIVIASTHSPAAPPPASCRPPRPCSSPSQRCARKWTSPGCFGG
jgi:hypothetical protein